MTAPKTTKKKDVERVFKSIERAFVAEVPDYPENLVFNVPDIPEPRHGTRAHVVWEALRTAFAARVRYRRRDILRKTAARGEPVVSFDDKKRFAAIRNLNRAWVLTGEAVALLQEAAAITEADIKAVPKELRDEVERVAVLERQFEPLLAGLNAFRGIHQIRTQREWDLFISETATKMQDVGFSSREVCGILTGSKPERIDRATMERFRQRVRRQLETGT